MNISTFWFLFLLVSIAANLLQWNLDKQDWIPECTESKPTQEIIIIEKEVENNLPNTCEPEIVYLTDNSALRACEEELESIEPIVECGIDPDVAVWMNSSDSWKYRAEKAERTLKQMGINPRNL